MGKGDRKTKRGKVFSSSYGKFRKKNKKRTGYPSQKKATADNE